MQMLNRWVVVGGVVALAACGPSAGRAGAGDVGTPGAVGAQTSPNGRTGDPPLGNPLDPTHALAKVLALPGPGQLYHGVLPAGVAEPDSDIAFSNLDAYEGTSGRKVAYVYFTNNWYQTKAFPATTANLVRARGSVPFIRLFMRSQFKTSVADPTYTLDRIARGDFDADLQAWADGAIAFRTPLIVEYGAEINGDWFPWSVPFSGDRYTGPGLFRAAYRHIVEVMRARGASNITWAWHVYSESYPSYPESEPKNYYPGDDVVDWVGTSAYASERPYDSRCPSLADLVERILPLVRDATQTKPFFLFEMGITAHNPNCPAGPWVRDALTRLLAGQWDIKGFSWWNEHWQNNGNRDQDTVMAIQDAPELASAFHDVLNGPAGGKLVDRPILK